MYMVVVIHWRLGPPWPIWSNRRGSSKICRPPIVEVMTTKMIVGRSIGHGDREELADARGTVEDGCLVEVLRDGLHRGEQDQRVVAGPAEVDHRRDRDVAGQDLRVPADRVDADVAEHGVDEAGLVGEQLAEDEADRDGRDDVGQQHAHAPEGARAQVRVEERREHDRDDQLGDRRQEEDAEGVAQALPEVRLLDDEQVVLEADEVTLAADAGSSRARTRRPCTRAGTGP